MIAIAFISTVCYAQHFKFMGIPMDGTIENFCLKLKEKGFVSSKTFSVLDKSTEKWLDGRYAGYDVSLLICSTPQSKMVNSVTVIYYVNYVNSEKRSNSNV